MLQVTPLDVEADLGRCLCGAHRPTRSEQVQTVSAVVPVASVGRMADVQFSESGKNVFRLGESGSEPRIRRVIGFVGYKTYHDYLGLLKALAQRHWPAENGSTRKKPPMMFVCV